MYWIGCKTQSGTQGRAKLLGGCWWPNSNVDSLLQRREAHIWSYIYDPYLSECLYIVSRRFLSTPQF